MRGVTWFPPQGMCTRTVVNCHKSWPCADYHHRPVIVVDDTMTACDASLAYPCAIMCQMLSYWIDATPYLWSLRWLGHVFRMPNDRLPKKLLLGEVKGLRHVAALGLVPMMLHYVIVKIVVLVGLTGMHKTGCSGETRLVLHIPSSSWAWKR